MAFVSVTRLRLRSILVIPAFLWKNEASVRQVKRSPGFLGGQLLIDRDFALWTMTLWTDDKSMMQFRNSGAHRKAMPKLAGWCSEASTVHWEQDWQTFDWLEAHERMLKAGREFPVHQRAEKFNVSDIPAPRISRLVRTLRPIMETPEM